MLPRPFTEDGTLNLVGAIRACGFQPNSKHSPRVAALV
jgi:hypothetical protein